MRTQVDRGIEKPQAKESQWRDKRFGLRLKSTRPAEVRPIRVRQESTGRDPLELNPPNTSRANAICVATKIVSAEEGEGGRNWVGMDISSKVADLVVERIAKQQMGVFRDTIHRTTIPQRTELGVLPRYN